MAKVAVLLGAKPSTAKAQMGKLMEFETRLAKVFNLFDFWG